MVEWHFNCTFRQLRHHLRQPERRQGALTVALEEEEASVPVGRRASRAPSPGPPPHPSSDVGHHGPGPPPPPWLWLSRHLMAAPLWPWPSHPQRRSAGSPRWRRSNRRALVAVVLSVRGGGWWVVGGGGVVVWWCGGGYGVCGGAGSPSKPENHCPTKPKTAMDNSHGLRKTTENGHVRPCASHAIRPHFTDSLLESSTHPNTTSLPKCAAVVLLAGTSMLGIPSSASLNVFFRSCPKLMAKSLRQTFVR